MFPRSYCFISKDIAVFHTSPGKWHHDRSVLPYSLIKREDVRLRNKFCKKPRGNNDDVFGTVPPCEGTDIIILISGNRQRYIFPLFEYLSVLFPVIQGLLDQIELYLSVFPVIS